MDPLDTALLDAWHTHITPRLRTSAGRAELTRRLQHASGLAGGPQGPASAIPYPSSPSRHVQVTSGARPLRAFTLVLRANDRRLPDHNTAGAVLLDADEIERLCAPIPLPPPGVPRIAAAHLLGVGPSAIPARVRAGHLVKHRPFPRVSTRTGKYPGDPPRSDVYFYAPPGNTPPHHLIHPVPDVQSADWGTLNQHLHQRPRNLPRNLSVCLAGDAQRPASPGSSAADTPGAWSQTLHRTVRQLRPQNPSPQYERFEWQCPTCPPKNAPPTDKTSAASGGVQRLYWPFRPMTLPAYLGFDFHQLAPELPPQHIAHLTSQIEQAHLPFAPGFTCRRCLQQQFGGQGLTYESAEFTSHHGKATGLIPKNTWHRFIQRLTMGMLTGREVQLKY